MCRAINDPLPLPEKFERTAAVKFYLSLSLWQENDDFYGIIITSRHVTDKARLSRASRNIAQPSKRDASTSQRRYESNNMKRNMMSRAPKQVAKNGEYYKNNCDNKNNN